jgi:hypothetical protein
MVGELGVVIVGLERETCKDPASWANLGVVNEGSLGVRKGATRPIGVGLFYDYDREGHCLGGVSSEGDDFFHDDFYGF